MPDLLTVALFAYPLASAALGYWIARQVDTFSSWRARRDWSAARAERRCLDEVRDENARLVGVLDEAFHSSEHKATGKRLADHCDRLKAERDHERRWREHWERAAKELAEQVEEHRAEIDTWNWLDQSA